MPSPRKSTYIPRIKQPGEAPPRGYDMLHAPKYKPEPMHTARVNADAHLQHKSRGV